MPENPITFHTFERVGGSPEAAEELKALHARLQRKTDADKYRSEHLVRWDEQPCGYAVIDVLPELVGLPLSDLVLAYVHALRPSAVRITQGTQTCDAVTWRVTIVVDEDDVVRSIRQEVRVGYGCGFDVAQCLRSAKDGQPPRPCPGVIGHTAALARVDFE